MALNNNYNEEQTPRQLPKGCKPVAACLDYRAFVLAFPKALSDAAYQRLLVELQSLGRSEPPRLGVFYIYSSWGFLVVPPPGFPELKVSFYNQTEPDRIAAILDQIASQLENYN